jgi:hypothetical protein
MKIQPNNFVLRQTATSRFTSFDGSWEEVAAMAEKAMAEGDTSPRDVPSSSPGYRDGVVLVHVPATEAARFRSGVVMLKSGDRLVGSYEPRREGEEPRKHVSVEAGGSKIPCKAVDIVLYRRDVLGDDVTHEDSEWEIVSVNGRPTEGAQPMAPETLIANHFEMDGGTATGMSDIEFVAALRASVMYWKDKAMMTEGE